MGKSADDQEWLEDLASARESEQDDGEDHPADIVDTQAEDKPEPEPKPEPKAESSESTTVPLAVLTEERNKLQARIAQAEQRNNELASQVQKLSTLEQEIRNLREAREAQNKPPPVDYLEDPKGYIDAQVGTTLDELRKVNETIQETTQAVGAQGQQLSTQRQIQAIQSMAAAGEEAFAKENTDYWEALDHLRNVRANQLRMAFPEANDNQIAEHIRAEEFSTAAQILQQGRNPAEYAYQYAKTVGYTPNQQRPKEPANAEAQEEARDNAQGLGSAGSNSELASLMDMDRDEFDQAMKEVFG